MVVACMDVCFCEGRGGGVMGVPDLCCVSTCRYPFAITGVNITTTMAGLVGLT